MHRRLFRLATATLVAATTFALSPHQTVLAQTTTPTVAFGTRHAVALRNNGEVLTWGDNVTCQLGRAGGKRAATPGLVLRNIKAIAVAATHTLALDVEGKVYAWGGDAPALGNADDNERCEGPEPVVSLADKTVAHIATGINFSLVVTTDGHLYCTGSNDQGQCPAAATRTGTSVFTRLAVPELTGKVAAIRAGAFHALVLTTDGKLYAFGRAREGQLGNGKTAGTFGPVLELTDVVSFAAGTWHSAAVRSDGSAWLWGSNGRSELCDGTTVNKPTPVRVAISQKVAQVAAGGSTTMLRTSDGALYACGDNQFGSLGAGTPRIVPKPLAIASGTSPAGIAVAGGSYGAHSLDGCAVRLAGTNGDGIVSGGDASGDLPYAVRQGVSLCGPKPEKPMPTRLFIPPTGGASGCWSPRVEEDAVANAKWASLRQAVLAAEDILRKNKVYLATPVPVRFRSAVSAGPMNESGAAIHVKAAPERKADRTRLWTGECGVSPQSDRIGGAIGQISIFFNRVDQFVSSTGEGPKLTGRFGGFPEYNNWVVITKDGRMPWIPQTLADKLDAEGARRKAKLAEWTKTRSNMKVMDKAAADKAAAAIRKTDPAGAEKFLATIAAQAEEAKRQERDVYPATTAQFEKEVKDYEAYRASFTPEQLRAPAVWGDPTGVGKRKLDAEIAALQALTPAEQAQVDALSRSGAPDRAVQIRTIRQRHLEAASPRMADANAQYALRNLRPGTADNAMSFKKDPSFPDFSNPNRIQVITVMVSYDPDPKQVERRAWQTRVKESLDYSALAALLK